MLFGRRLIRAQEWTARVWPGPLAGHGAEPIGLIRVFECLGISAQPAIGEAQGVERTNRVGSQRGRAAKRLDGFRGTASLELDLAQPPPRAVPSWIELERQPPALFGVFE